jgi:hypothetical protein
MQTKGWTQISCNFSPDNCKYAFDVDFDGFLTFIRYEFDSPSKPLKKDDQLFRIALKIPEKLSYLCWFKARKFNLPFIKPLTDSVFY